MAEYCAPSCVVPGCVKPGIRSYQGSNFSVLNARGLIQINLQPFLGATSGTVAFSTLGSLPCSRDGLAARRERQHHHRSEYLFASRPSQRSGCVRTPVPRPSEFKNDQLTSCPSHTSADGSPRLADGGSCHAYAVNAGPAYAAGGSDLRNHAVWLNNRRWCHRLRRHCNR